MAKISQPPVEILDKIVGSIEDACIKEKFNKWLDSNDRSNGDEYQNEVIDATVVKMMMPEAVRKAESFFGIERKMKRYHSFLRLSSPILTHLDRAKTLLSSTVQLSYCLCCAAYMKKYDIAPATRYIRTVKVLASLWGNMIYDEQSYKQLHPLSEIEWLRSGFKKFAWDNRSDL